VQWDTLAFRSRAPSGVIHHVRYDCIYLVGVAALVPLSGQSLTHEDTRQHCHRAVLVPTAWSRANSYTLTTLVDHSCRVFLTRMHALFKRHHADEEARALLLQWLARLAVSGKTCHADFRSTIPQCLCHFAHSYGLIALKTRLKTVSDILDLIFKFGRNVSDTRDTFGDEMWREAAKGLTVSSASSWQQLFLVKKRPICYEK